MLTETYVPVKSEQGSPAIATVDVISKLGEQLPTPPDYRTTLEFLDLVQGPKYLEALAPKVLKEAAQEAGQRLYSSQVLVGYDSQPPGFSFQYQPKDPLDLAVQLLTLQSAEQSHRGLYWCPNQIQETWVTKGKRSLIERSESLVTHFRAVWFDYDSPRNTEQEANFQTLCSLFPPTAIVQSSTEGKNHVYWLLEYPEPATAETWDCFNRFVSFYGDRTNSDPAVRNPCHILRLPGTLHTKDPQNMLLVQVLELHPERRYTLKQLSDGLPAVEVSINKKKGISSQKTYNSTTGTFIQPTRTTRPDGAFLLLNIQNSLLEYSLLKDGEGRNLARFKLGTQVAEYHLALIARTPESIKNLYLNPPTKTSDPASHTLATGVAGYVFTPQLTGWVSNFYRACSTPLFDSDGVPCKLRSHLQDLWNLLDFVVRATEDQAQPLEAVDNGFTKAYKDWTLGKEVHTPMNFDAMTAHRSSVMAMHARFPGLRHNLLVGQLETASGVSVTRERAISEIIMTSDFNPVLGAITNEFLAAKENKFHPFREQIAAIAPSDSISWEEVAENMIPPDSNGERPPIALMFFRTLFMALVNRALNPGCFEDRIWLLASQQGIGKDEMIKTLTAVDEYPEHSARNYYTLNMSKSIEEQVKHMVVASIVNISEINSDRSRKAKESLKTYTTETHCVWEPKYVEGATYEPKGNITIASTNDPTPLTDSQNRRFVLIDLMYMDKEVWALGGDRGQWLKDNRDRIYAKAKYDLEHAPELLYFTDEERVLKNEVNEAHRSEDAWETDLKEWLDNFLDTVPPELHGHLFLRPVKLVQKFADEPKSSPRFTFKQNRCREILRDRGWAPCTKAVRLPEDDAKVHKCWVHKSVLNSLPPLTERVTDTATNMDLFNWAEKHTLRHLAQSKGLEIKNPTP